MTSDDLLPGSLTAFQSSRVARASKAPHFGSLLSSSVRDYLDAYKQRMLRLVLSELAHMEARLGPAGRYVDPVFHSSTVDDTMLVSFTSWSKLVPSRSLKMPLHTLV